MKNVELITMDLGNLQTKLKSRVREEVMLSSFIPSDEMGTSVLNKSMLQLSNFESELDKGVTYTWGKDLVKLTQKDLFISTLGFTNRYGTLDYKLLSEFALGYMANDFDSASTEEGLDVVLVLGVPTGDLDNPIALEEIGKNMKREHTIVIDGSTLKVNVLGVEVLPQPLGTIYDMTIGSSSSAKLNSTYLEANVGVCDIGGGTILMDRVEQGNYTKDRSQLSLGAFKFYDDLLVRYVGKTMEDGESKVTATAEDLAQVLREGSDETGYFYKPNKNTVIDISDIVAEQKATFTRNSVFRNIKATFKELNRMDYIIFTGGGANLLDMKMLENYLEPYKVSVVVNSDSELSNVRGFYKYGEFMKLPKVVSEETE